MMEESFLLDDSGHVVVRSSYDEGAETPQSRGDSALELPLFEEIAVVAALLEGRSGYLELPSEDGSRLVAWYRMSGIGWYYAVTADAEELLEASQRSP